MDNEYLLLTGALKVFANFEQTSCENYVVEHDGNNSNFELLRGKYPIVEIAGNGNDFSKALNLLRWVHNHVPHFSGDRVVEIPNDSISILDCTFNNGRVPGIFCYHIAIVFTECCLAAGLTARKIHCKPFSPNDMETHVVSMVYISQMHKWVLFDPDNNAYFTDKNGVALSPLEARNALGQDEIYVVGTPQAEPDWYKQYMAKNLFYIKFWAKNTFGTDMVKEQSVYFLAPLGFDVRGREMDYCEYAIKKSPLEYQKGWMDYLAELRKQHIVTVSEEQFLRIV